MKTIVEKKKCRITGEEFVVTDKDNEFYEKLGVPPPSLCPTELWRNLFAFRNEWNLFHRTCSQSGKKIISCYRPETTFPVYDHPIWWSDDWSAGQYGRTIDFDQPFFPQYGALQSVVPRPGTNVFNSENCAYTGYARFCKNSYLAALLTRAENVYYSYWTIGGNMVVDCAMTTECEYCYQCLDTLRCHTCFCCQESQDCRECYFSFELRNCRNCIACSGLENKDYHIDNQPVSREKFEEIKNLLTQNEQYWENAVKKLLKIRKETTQPPDHNIACENCTGDHMKNCSDCSHSFDGVNSEKCHHCMNFSNAKDSIWSYSLFESPSENVAFTCVTTQCMDVVYSFAIYQCQNAQYSDSCRNSHDIFGCVGVNHAEYTILNKSYSKHEYETLRMRLIDHMKSTNEWGEFFPLQYSPYPYDDSAAMDWYPLDREGVISRGGYYSDEFDRNSLMFQKFDWQEVLKNPSYLATHMPRTSDCDEQKVGYEIAKKNIDTVLAQAYTCSISQRPFQIIAPELAYYISHHLPLPRLHPRIRTRLLTSLRKPRNLFY